MEAEQSTGTEAPTLDVKPEQQVRRRHIQLINAESSLIATPANLLPLSACDCDNHCEVDVCVADQVDVNACGIWG
jgi:hypothetical protein